MNDTSRRRNDQSDGTDGHVPPVVWEALESYRGERMNITCPPTYSLKLPSFQGGVRGVHGYRAACLDICELPMSI